MMLTTKLRWKLKNDVKALRGYTRPSCELAFGSPNLQLRPPWTLSSHMPHTKNLAKYGKIDGMGGLLDQ
jgi:hypothetical protein